MVLGHKNRVVVGLYEDILGIWGIWRFGGYHIRAHGSWLEVRALGMGRGYYWGT